MSDDHPVGTPAELTALGVDLQKWGSCARQSAGPDGERGCRHYPCKFRLPEYGGFMDKGPRFVGVLKHLQATGVAREDYMECFRAMDLFPRDKHSDETGEHFKIVAQEGEEIHTYTIVPVEKDGVSNKTNNNKLRKVYGEEGKEDQPFLVPRFPRPGEQGSLIQPALVETQKILALAAQREEEAQRMRVMKRGAQPIVVPAEAETDPPVEKKRGPRA